jgi:DNA-binding SARP family transcriptional activator
LSELVQVEPRFWIPRLPDAHVGDLDRSAAGALIEAIERNAAGDAIDVVSHLPGPDFRALRTRLIHRQAPRLFVQTLGKLEVRRGTWTAAPLPMRRRRTRALLGLLAAHAGVPISRDAVLDTLWPEADPAAAVNSLNQTLFQLRREMDPGFKAGQSPEYVLTSVDALQLNPDLVKIDWVEVTNGGNGIWTRRSGPGHVAHATQLVQGEFLPEAQYDDWSYAHRRRIHEELRETLLPMATDVSRPANDRAKVARAAIALDPFDETAHVALARAFSDSGRRAAGLRLLRDFARRLSDEFDEAPSADLSAAADRLR